MVGSLALLMFGFARRHHGGGFVVFFSCLLCASSLTAFLLSGVPSARYAALVKMASKDPPMKSWVVYYLDDHQITWLESGLLHVAYATVHPNRAVLEPAPDRKRSSFVRSSFHGRRREGSSGVRGASLFGTAWSSVGTQVVGEGNRPLSFYRVSRPAPTKERDRPMLSSAGGALQACQRPRWSDCSRHEPPHCPHLLGATL